MSTATRTPSDRPVETPAAIVPQRTDIVGSVVRLEPLDAERHGADLYQASHESEAALHVWDYLTCGPYSSVEEYKAALRSQSVAFDPVYFAIVDIKTSRALGQASFLDIKSVHGSIEIGHIWFAPALQRTRGGTEALFLLMCHAFDNMGYRRLQWRCNALNEKSRKTAARLGFNFEGIFYNDLVAKGRNRDTAWFSITIEEWPKRRDAIENWLSLSNFDECGVACSSLSAAIVGPATC